MTIIMLKDISKINVPYFEDTTSWHAWLDILHLGKTKNGNQFTVNDLAAANGMPVDYYNHSLDELLADYYITIEE
jgi:hypothetical protein